MGVPIPHYEDEPLKRRKGYFGLRSTSAIVGQTASAVFPEQQLCHNVFHPILQFPGAVVCNSWDDITLHFIYGHLNTGGGKQRRKFNHFISSKLLCRSREKPFSCKLTESRSLPPSFYYTAFFKVKPLQQLIFLGTKEHGRLRQLDDPLPIDPPHEDFGSHQPISPGFVEFQDWLPGETESDDEAGFRESPAVYLGGDPGGMLDGLFPKCLCCDQQMKYVGQLETDAFSDDL